MSHDFSLEPSSGGFFESGREQHGRKFIQKFWSLFQLFPTSGQLANGGEDLQSSFLYPKSPPFKVSALASGCVHPGRDSHCAPQMTGSRNRFIRFGALLWQERPVVPLGSRLPQNWGNEKKPERKTVDRSCCPSRKPLSNADFQTRPGGHGTASRASQRSAGALRPCGCPAGQRWPTSSQHGPRPLSVVGCPRSLTVQPFGFF